MPVEVMVWIVVVTALVFDFTNGFHDSANAMATAVSTGAYKPKVAVLLAAIMNLVGACMSTAVAGTISHGIVNDALVTPQMVFAALVGAILWNLFTWLLGLPSSSSHALFGALIGAVIVSAGLQGVHGGTIVSRILLPALVAPVVAGIAAYLSTKVAYRSLKHIPKGGKKRFRYAQRASSLLVALSHGTSDGQKTMGIITLVLVAGTTMSGTQHWWGYDMAALDAAGQNAEPHWWVILAAGLAIALGTYSGGWRIMRTMGKGMADIEPPQGFAVETSSMAAILSSAHLGFALSTTHVVSGAVIGTGLSRTPDEVRWRTARNMGIGWLLTLPASALVGAGAAWLAHKGAAGFIAVLVVLAAAAAAIKLLAGRHHVSAENVTDSHEIRVFGKATEPPATPPTQGALAPVLAPALPVTKLPDHPLAATPLALTRLKQPKKRPKSRPAPIGQDPLPGLDLAPDVVEDVLPAVAAPAALTPSPASPASPALTPSPASPASPGAGVTVPAEPRGREGGAA
jgi:PiT family inorganic phosphate transporter